MKINFNPNLYTPKLKKNLKQTSHIQNTQNSKNPIYYTQQENSSFQIYQTFQGKKDNLKRTLALLNASLLLANMSAPIILPIDKAVVGIYSQDSTQNEAFEKMQKISQRLYELHFEIMVLDSKIEKSEKAQSENLDKQSKLYDKLDFERREDDEEQNEIRRKIEKLQEEQFKLVSDWGRLYFERDKLEATRTWLREELYRLQDIKSGHENSTVPMPYSEEHYVNYTPENVEAIEGSRKNGFYKEFEYKVLSECEDTTESGIIAELMECSKDYARLRPKADEYLKELEAFRVEFNTKLSQISDILDKMKQWAQENNVESYIFYADAAPEDMQQRLKSLQDERDEICDRWFDNPARAYSAQYEEYVDLILKIIVLESKLQEIRSKR